MSQNGTSFRWDGRHSEAATLLVEDRLTDEQISKRVGCSRRQLARWKSVPEFKAKLAELRQELANKVRRRGITNLSRRLTRADRDWEALHRIIDERAKDPELQHVPGGSTGLLVRRVKSIRVGDKSGIVEEYTVDGKLLNRILDLERHVAKQLGQFGPQKHVSEGAANHTDEKTRAYTDDEKWEIIITLLTELGVITPDDRIVELPETVASGGVGGSPGAPAKGPPRPSTSHAAPPDEFDRNFMAIAPNTDSSATTTAGVAGEVVAMARQ